MESSGFQSKNEKRITEEKHETNVSASWAALVQIDGEKTFNVEDSVHTEQMARPKKEKQKWHADELSCERKLETHQSRYGHKDHQHSKQRRSPQARHADKSGKI